MALQIIMSHPTRPSPNSLRSIQLSSPDDIAASFLLRERLRTGENTAHLLSDLPYITTSLTAQERKEIDLLIKNEMKTFKFEHPSTLFNEVDAVLNEFENEVQSNAPLFYESLQRLRKGKFNPDQSNVRGVQPIQNQPKSIHDYRQQITQMKTDIALMNHELININLLHQFGSQQWYSYTDSLIRMKIQCEMLEQKLSENIAIVNRKRKFDQLQFKKHLNELELKAKDVDAI